MIALSVMMKTSAKGMFPDKNELISASGAEWRGLFYTPERRAGALWHTSSLPIEDVIPNHCAAAVRNLLLAGTLR
jgi:hypothetical protein